MKRLETFETGKTIIDAVLFMLHDEEGFKTIANLEWMSEEKNREDLVSNGFKLKKFSTPWWIKQKCGDIFENNKKQ